MYTKIICDHSNFREWNNGVIELTETLNKVAEINVTPAKNQVELKYWGEDAPIVLELYPYYGCEIFECKKCKSPFFHYTELGGHGPQERYRLIRKELIR
jgi:hypothetical protein